jgi:hypothetical protein
MVFCIYKRQRILIEGKDLQGGAKKPDFYNLKKNFNFHKNDSIQGFVVREIDCANFQALKMLP